MSAAILSEMLQQRYRPPEQTFMIPWNAGRPRRLNHNFEQSLHFSTPEGASYNVSLETTETGDVRVTSDGQTINISQLSVQGDTFSAEVG